MKNYRFSFLILFVMVAFPAALKAQFVLSGELRPRFEYRHGFKLPASAEMKAATFVSQRSRLNVGYQNDKMRVGLSLQDVRVWGDVAQLNTDDQHFSVHEAWGEFFMTPALSLKFGRMELVYDDARILGNVDWAQQGRSHDLALLKFEKSGWKAHAGFAFNQEKENLAGTFYEVTGNYKAMQLLWLNRKMENFSASLLFLNNGKENVIIQNDEQDYNTLYSQTFGGTATYNLKPVSLNGSIYKTVGKEVGEVDVDALYYALNIKWAITNDLSLTPGIEHLSGTSQKDRLNPDFNTSNSFNPFYGTNHKFNGHMDYYFVGNHINNVGLNDIFVKLNYGKGRFSVGGDLNFFSAAADVLSLQNNSITLDNDLGQELDLYVGYKIADGIMFNAGYSHYFTTETTTALKGGSTDETSNWAWASISFKPEFFRYSK